MAASRAGWSGSFRKSKVLKFDFADNIVEELSRCPRRRQSLLQAMRSGFSRAITTKISSLLLFGRDATSETDLKRAARRLAEATSRLEVRGWPFRNLGGIKMPVFADCARPDADHPAVPVSRRVCGLADLDLTQRGFDKERFATSVGFRLL